jgi:hypothetical protein
MEIAGTVSSVTSETYSGKADSAPAAKNRVAWKGIVLASIGGLLFLLLLLLLLLLLFAGGLSFALGDTGGLDSRSSFSFPFPVTSGCFVSCPCPICCSDIKHASFWRSCSNCSTIPGSTSSP